MNDGVGAVGWEEWTAEIACVTSRDTKTRSPALNDLCRDVKGAGGLLSEITSLALEIESSTMTFCLFYRVAE